MPEAPCPAHIAMLHQPRVPPTGQRQAIEIQIKWREVLSQKQALLRILSKTTGHSEEKLDKAGPLLPYLLMHAYDTSTRSVHLLMHSRGVHKC